MSKVTKTVHAYITIEVDQPTWKGTPWGREAQEKSSEVRRLINAASISGLGRVSYEVEAPTVCSFCGYGWEEDADGPCCCDKAVDEWKAANHV